MKKIISITLVFIMCAVLFSACAPSTGGSANNNDTKKPLSDGRTLKVLAIGNSFSNDTTQYLFDIALAHGATEIVLGRLYISGCTLSTHLSNAQSNKSAYSYYKNTYGLWEEKKNVSLLYALQDEQWDIITLQQGSATSGVKSSYNVLDKLITYVNNNKTNANAQLVWNMTWAYQTGSSNSGFANYKNDQMTMYNAICSTVQEKVVPVSQIHSVIPAGTAIQNARTSSIGDNLTRDTYHLNQLGRVLTAYTWYAVFTGSPLTEVKATTMLDGFALTDMEMKIIIESVNNALSNPYTVTQSTYTG